MISNNIIAVINQKGGVGKTTTTVNLAAVLASIGFKTLIVDFDPQGHAGTSLGLDVIGLSSTIYESLIGHKEVESAIVNVTSNLDIICSNIHLVAADVELAKFNFKEHILKNTLLSINRKYDFVFIDCPPSLNILSVNALTAANMLIIPVQCEYLALEGLSKLLSTIEIIQNSKLNQNLRLLGVILTMYDKRVKLTELIEEDIKKCLKALVFTTVIPRTVRIAEAPSHGKSIIDYDYKCFGSTSYFNLAREILNRLNY